MLVLDSDLFYPMLVLDSDLFYPMLVLDSDLFYPMLVLDSDFFDPISLPYRENMHENRYINTRISYYHAEIQDKRHTFPNSHTYSSAVSPNTLFHTGSTTGISNPRYMP
jgi:hypothetical protein